MRAPVWQENILHSPHFLSSLRILLCNTFIWLKMWRLPHAWHTLSWVVIMPSWSSLSTQLFSPQIRLSLGNKRLMVHLRPNGSHILLPRAAQISMPRDTPIIVTCGFGASGLEEGSSPAHCGSSGHVRPLHSAPVPFLLEPEDRTRESCSVSGSGKSWRASSPAWITSEYPHPGLVSAYELILLSNGTLN